MSEQDWRPDCREEGGLVYLDRVKFCWRCHTEYVYRSDVSDKETGKLLSYTYYGQGHDPALCSVELLREIVDTLHRQFGDGRD